MQILNPNKRSNTDPASIGLEKQANACWPGSAGVMCKLKMKNQLTHGKESRLMYVENKNGQIDGFDARIGWVTFSKTGKSIYYRGRTFGRLKGGGISGNYFCEDTGDEYWISGIKKKGSNVHWAESARVHIDEDAIEEFRAIRNT